ncbi:hypothetical protein A3218_05650 [Pseudomonas chlororaphis]|uniref:tail fiber protein n=1 Tax=Pseudomonas chlororaphis TaxID=587753 RepID=UPI000789F695|nr:tail fiber protein [Pseudomonas chlororaphis]AMS13803.1 hypothetical protein A3218_05650 [Pseudomonas chlororaphis]
MVDTIGQDAVGPSVEKLKDVFGIQQVPLASNFSDLIDVADVGRKAVGLSPAQDGIPGLGLQLDASQKLAVQPKAAGGVQVDSAGVGIIPDASHGIKVDVNGIGINFGTSLKVAEDKLEVADSFHASLSTLSKGVDLDTVIPPAYKTGVYGVDNGCTYPNRPATADGLAGNAFLKLFTYTPDNSLDCTQIYFNAVGGMWLRAKHDGAAVFTAWQRVNAVTADPEKGIKVNDNVVGVDIEANKGLSVGANGIAIQAGPGITVGSAGVSVDVPSLLPSGMIMMFYGSAIPSGWAICDGSRGTPDLRDRFIMGGTMADKGIATSQTVSGTAAAKTYTATTNTMAPTINVNVAGTTLSLSQIPSHSHHGGLQLRDDSSVPNVTRYGYDVSGNGGVQGSISTDQVDGNRSQARLARSESVGGNASHSHSASGSQSPHSHVVNVVPPYCIMVFIMRL